MVSSGQHRGGGQEGEALTPPTSSCYAVASLTHSHVYKMCKQEDSLINRLIYTNGINRKIDMKTIDRQIEKRERVP